MRRMTVTGSETNRVDEQLGFDGMPRRLYSCTPSRVGAWLDCPRRYRMAYLDRPMPPKGPPWAHNSLGASVHNALAAWWRLPREKRTPEAAGTLLDAGWISEGFRDDEQSMVWRTRAHDMVVQYVATLDRADEPLGVERTVGTTTDTLALSGRVDRLDERVSGDGTELVVVDYKTGRHVCSEDDARGSLALAVYAAAAERTLRKPCHRVELHHIPTGTVAAFEHTDESLARQIGRVELAASESRGADERHRAGLTAHEVETVFPPTPSSLCGWCDFRRHCPEGRAAAPERQPWGGLADAFDAV